MNRRSVLQFLGLTPLAGPLIGKEAVSQALTKEALVASSVTMGAGKGVDIASKPSRVIKGKFLSQTMVKKSRMMGFLTGNLHDADQYSMDYTFLGWKKQHEKSSVEGLKSVSSSYKALKEKERIQMLIVQSAFVSHATGAAHDSANRLPYRDPSESTPDLHYKPNGFSKWLMKRLSSD